MSYYLSAKILLFYLDGGYDQAHSYGYGGYPIPTRNIPSG